MAEAGVPALSLRVSTGTDSGSAAADGREARFNSSFTTAPAMAAPITSLSKVFMGLAYEPAPVVAVGALRQGGWACADRFVAGSAIQRDSVHLTVVVEFDGQDVVGRFHVDRVVEHGAIVF